MADARQCDICGEYFIPVFRPGKHDHDTLMFYNKKIEQGLSFYSENSSQDIGDCCPNCMAVVKGLIRVLSLDRDNGFRSEIVTDILDYAEKLKEV